MLTLHNGGANGDYLDGKNGGIGVGSHLIFAS
jgi:hypothetical protein